MDLLAAISLRTWGILGIAVLLLLGYILAKRKRK